MNFYSLGTDYIVDQRSKEAIELQNSSTTPWRFNADVRVDKSIHLGHSLTMLFYIRILNIFNSKQIENVYPYSYSAAADGMIHENWRTAAALEAFGEKARDIYDALNTTNSQSYWEKTGNELYLNPRQIFFGIRLNY